MCRYVAHQKVCVHVVQTKPFNLWSDVERAFLCPLVMLPTYLCIKQYQFIAFIFFSCLDRNSHVSQLLQDKLAEYLYPSYNQANITDH